MPFENLGTQNTITQDFFDRLQQTIAYNGDGTVNTITATGSFGGVTVTWVKTLSYSSGKLSGVSEWVKQ